MAEYLSPYADRVSVTRSVGDWAAGDLRYFNVSYVMRTELLARCVPNYLRPGFADAPIEACWRESKLRDAAYHRGRVAYFKQLCELGYVPDAITVSSGEVTVLDGHHRLAGAILAGLSHVPVVLEEIDAHRSR